VSTPESWLGQIPGDWQLRRLSTLGTFAKGSGGSKEDNRDKGLPVVRYGELYTRFDKVIAEAHSFIGEDAAPRYTRLHRGTIVFAGSGEDPEDIGKSALSLLEDPVFVGGDTVLFTPTSGEVDGVYLAYVLESRPLKALKAIRATGFTVVHISAGKLKTLPIPLPPLAEQRAIVESLVRETARIDELVAEQQCLIDLLRERRVALRAHVALHGTVPTDEVESALPWARSLPADWRVVPLTSVAQLESGHTPSRVEKTGGATAISRG